MKAQSQRVVNENLLGEQRRAEPERKVFQCDQAHHVIVEPRLVIPGACVEQAQTVASAEFPEECPNRVEQSARHERQLPLVAQQRVNLLNDQRRQTVNEQRPNVRVSRHFEVEVEQQLPHGSVRHFRRTAVQRVHIEPQQQVKVLHRFC